MTLQERIADDREYTMYPRGFDSYKWYKPLIVAVLGYVFFLIFSVAIYIVAGGFAGDIFSFASLASSDYDDMKIYTGPAAIAQFSPFVAILLAIALCAMIVRDRPYSSYSSSRGGWNWGIFVKCMVIALIICGIPNIIVCLLDNQGGGNSFTTAGFILVTLLVPLQCASEEYLYRGFLMQTFGSWFRIPVLAIVVQALFFAASHPYNTLGVLEILVTGLVFGFTAFYTKGLEAPCALHIVNNLVAFYFAGFGITAITSTVTLKDFILDCAIKILFALLIIYCDRRYRWFDTVRKDDRAAWNEKRAAKLAAKQAR